MSKPARAWATHGQRRVGGLGATLLAGLLVAVPSTPATRPGALLDGVAGGPTAGAGRTAPAAVVREVRISDGGSRRVPNEGASEPVVATHPTDPARLAVAYLRFAAGGPCHADPTLVISHDAGRTWVEAAARPWAGSGRCPGMHAAIAWGPGPRGARLYWTDMVTAAGGLRLGIAWTDDEGATWSRLHVEDRTPPWVGGFPDITVDRSAASPNLGVVYVVYNWPGDASRGPGIRLLASGDFGVSWRPLEIGRAPSSLALSASWRIDGRVRTGPDGSAYVAFFQEDLRTWDAAHVFWKGPWGSVGRVGYAVSRVTFDRSTGRLVATPTVMATALPVNAWTAYSAATPGTTDNLADPTWSLSLDVDPATGRVLLAVGDYGLGSRADAPRGTIRVGRSDDHGRTWRWTTVAALPAIAGRAQSSFRPELVAIVGVVVLCLRGITEVPVGTSPALRIPTLGVAWTLSLDGGVTFAAPRPVTAVRWSAAALATATNGPGLRDRAERTADGHVIYVYGDGRLARPAPDPRSGRVAVYGAPVAVVPPSGAPAAGDWE